jgi:hypothetical protein
LSVVPLIVPVIPTRRHRRPSAPNPNKFRKNKFRLHYAAHHIAPASTFCLLVSTTPPAVPEVPIVLFGPFCFFFNLQ